MKKISKEALNVLSTMKVAPIAPGRWWPGVTVRITGGMLDRKVYQEVNTALESIGGVWARGLKAHRFDRSEAEVKALVLTKCDLLSTSIAERRLRTEALASITGAFPAP